jgi:hypothetical protein
LTWPAKPPELKTPPVADAVVGHAPFHRALQVR